MSDEGVREAEWVSVCVPVYVVSVLCVQSEVILLACVALL